MIGQCYLRERKLNWINIVTHLLQWSGVYVSICVICVLNEQKRKRILRWTTSINWIIFQKQNVLDFRYNTLSWQDHSKWKLFEFMDNNLPSAYSRRVRKQSHINGDLLLVFFIQIRKKTILSCLKQVHHTLYLKRIVFVLLVGIKFVKAF